MLSNISGLSTPSRPIRTNGVPVSCYVYQFTSTLMHLQGWLLSISMISHSVGAVMSSEQKVPACSIQSPVSVSHVLMYKQYEGENSNNNTSIWSAVMSPIVLIACHVNTYQYAPLPCILPSAQSPSYFSCTSFSAGQQYVIVPLPCWNKVYIDTRKTIN